MKTKNIMDIIFVLDKSGSMHNLTADTIGGFNSLIKKQKLESQDDIVFVTTVLFNDKTQLLHDRVLIEEVEKMTTKNYVAGGNTALYDAVGYAISRAEQQQNLLAEKPQKTLMVITTDGYENSSKEYKHSLIKKLIMQKREQGWEFLFLGANIEAEDFAEDIGIDRASACRFSASVAGVRDMYWHVDKFIAEKKIKK